MVEGEKKSEVDSWFFLISPPPPHIFVFAVWSRTTKLPAEEAKWNHLFRI